MLWLPVAIGLLCFVVPRRAVPALASVGSLVVLARAIVARRGLPRRPAGPPAHRERELDPRPRRPLPARRRRHQRLPDPADGAAVGGGDHLLRLPRSRPARGSTSSCSASAETAALGAFLAQDLLLFVLFFDLMLVPFWFLIGAFGGENRIAATTKMIVYTLVGSLLMLVAAIATAILAADQMGHLSFSIADLRANTLGTGSQYWIFCFFAAAFLIKMPAFLVHGWLPDAYRAAPLPVLALLSGVLSKVGAYGFLRVGAAALPAGDGPLPGADPGDRRRQHPLRLGDGVHPDQRAPDRRLLLDRPARLHHHRDLLPATRRRRRLGAPDGQPRPGGRRRSS